jgi:hypothetical protein
MYATAAEQTAFLQEDALSFCKFEQCFPVGTKSLKLHGKPESVLLL